MCSCLEMQYKWLIILYTTKTSFQMIIFCMYPNLEGIKDTLGYKLIQKAHDWSELQCHIHVHNNGGRRDVFLNERREVPRVSRDLLSRLSSLERSKRRGLFFVIVHSLSESGGRFNVQAERECCHCSDDSCCIEGCGLQINRFKVCAAACALWTLTYS